MCWIYASMRKSTQWFEKLKHRGPDMSSVVTLESWIVLGFHRLAIQDLSEKGMQPFSISRKDLKVSWICNGELYNYKELQQEFPDQVWKSSSDCEVIWYLYLKYWWDGMMSRVDGEFAIVLVSEIAGSETVVYAGRDRFGVRPLYLWESDGWWTISSELKWLKKESKSMRQLDPSMSLRIGIDGEKSDIQEYSVPCGWSSSSLWSHDSPKETLKQIKSTMVEKFEKAVKRRLLADRPLACLQEVWIVVWCVLWHKSIWLNHFIPIR